MKAVGIIAAIVIGVAAALATGDGSIVASFPGVRPTCDLDWHGGYLYQASGAAIWEITTSGSFVRTIPIGSYVQPVGVERTDVEFWTCRMAGSTGYIHHLTTTGSYLNSFTTPFSGRGIAYGGGYLWCTSGSAVYKITTVGSVVSSFPKPGNYVSGISWAGPYLWVSDEWTGGAIYQVTTSGSVVRSIFRPSQRPYGVAWDGRYVWYTDVLINWIYAMTVAVTSAEPASLGRVKAVFR
jgi:hypothetical protein